MKTVYFMTGPSPAAAPPRELPIPCLDPQPDNVRIVFCGPRPQAEQNELIRTARLSPEQVLSYSIWAWPAVWLRLLWFLGWSRRVSVVCPAAPDSAAVKLLALALRGRVTFVLPAGQSVCLTLPGFLWLACKTFGRRSGEICLVGTAGRDCLERILADLRRRNPGVPIHALLPASSTDLADLPVETWARLSARNLVASCRRRPRFATRVIPWTQEGHLGLKCLAWCLPLGYREIYNENGDCYSAREVPVLLGHAWWRFRDGCGWLYRRLRALPDRLTVLGSASPQRLAAIVAVLRRRRPDATCHGFLPPDRAAQANLFDSFTLLRAGSAETYRSLLSCAIGRKRSGYLVVPFTGEGYRLLKLLFWLLPLGRREFHNEHGDFCPARDWPAFFAHVGRRLWSWLTRRPERITVLGSASGLYLKAIVADVRRRRPGAPVHGLLPCRLVVPVAGLFDSYTVLRPFSGAFWSDFLSLSVGRRRSGYFVIPCTNERYTSVKLLGFWLPFGLREIYNENSDAYFPRHLPTLVRHTFWRLRHLIFYQALTERNGRLWLLHLVHLLVYPLRLVAGALLLAGVRLRSRVRHRLRPAAPVVAPEGRFREDLIGADTPLPSGEPVVSGDP